LSASTPFHKGKLLDSDTRWEFICQSVDDRNPSERKEGGITKSRYSSINMYISDDYRNFKCYTDVKKKINRGARKFLKRKAKDMGLKMDKKLVDHFASLFVRDNLCIFNTTVEHEVNLDETKLFEAIQSTNWNDVRFKPPPSMGSSIGWRVEFRSMDVQATSELTFLFCHSVQVLSRMLIRLHDEINFYIPITCVNENFIRANKVNAATTQKFFFRTNLFEAGKPHIEELTISEIFNGKVGTLLTPGTICRLAQGDRYIPDTVSR
jgi:glutamate--cysteine ligase catalytic subunit